MSLQKRINPRVPWHDYGADAWYFITICSWERRCVFGRITENTFCHSSLGSILQQEWERTFSLRNDLLKSEFVIMPNHLHALFGIIEATEGHNQSYVPRIVNGFKSTCTKRANEIGYKNPVWQRGYHEHIVRNKLEWERIRTYIYQNPEVWLQDRYFLKEE